MIRKSIFLFLAAALLYGAIVIYTENGYGGMQADFSLLKYIVGIDSSGGVLEEHVSSYMEDRASSILIAMLLAIASFFALFKGLSRKENASGAAEEG